MNRRDDTMLLLNRLRMRQLALLLAIDEEKTLHKAAGRLGLSQPAATKMLRELEETLGFSLFERQHRRLEINAAGRRVLAYCQSLRGMMESLNRELVEIRQGNPGRLAIGSIMAASPGKLTKAVLDLKERYPGLSMEIAVDTSNRLLEQLREGVLELVIGRLTGHHDAGYRFCPIADEMLCLVSAVDHPLVGRKQASLHELHRFGWVMQPEGSPMRAVVEQEFHENALSLPEDVIETGSMLTTMNLLRHSHRVAVLPATVAQYNDEHGILKVLPYRIRRSLDSYGSIVMKDRPLSMPARHFMELLHDDRRQDS